ncbi:MAG: histidine phosphatase family protein [Hyphomicrobiales bacterium]|nr:MAG: histidine phosphatase family protein [Hyphomicrobiales bacterium]
MSLVLTGGAGVPPTKWWWIRHAPVPDGGRIYGQADLDCDTSDAQIFKVLAHELPADAVWITSNLARTKQTAAAIMAAAPERFYGIEPEAIPALAEQHLGDWQGLDRRTFYAERGVGTHSLWFSPATERAPNGESFADLVDRVAPVVTDLNRKHRGRDIVAVTHGGTIRAAVALALGLDPEGALSFSTENCSLTRLDYLQPEDKPGVWRVVCVNHRPWVRPPHHAQSTDAPGGLQRA